MNNYEMMLVEVVKNHPGEPASSYGKRLGLDRSQVRRGLERIAETSGEIIVREDRIGKKLFWPQGYTGYAAPAPPIAGPRGQDHYQPPQEIIEDADWVPSFDSRLSQKPSTSTAVTIHRMPDTAITGGRRAAPPRHNDIMSAMPDIFQLDPDGSLTAGMLNRQAIGAVADENTELRDENAQLRGALIVSEKAREDAKKQAEWDWALGAMSKHLHASVEASEPAQQSMAATKREKREQRKIEADAEAEELFQAAVTKQKKAFPWLYADDDMSEPPPVATPAPRPATQKRLRPIGDILGSAKQDAPKPAIPRSVQWGIAGVVAAALVGLMIWFPVPG